MMSTLRIAKPWLGLAGLALFVGFAFWYQSAGAAPRAWKPNASIAVVDLSRIMDSLDEVKKLNDQLIQRGQERKAKVDGRRDDLIKKGKEIDALPKGPERIQALAELFEMEAGAKGMAEALDRIMDLDRGEVMRTIYNKINDSIAEMATTDQIDLVIFDDRSFVKMPDPKDPVSDKSMTGVIQSRRVLFASKDVDITDQLIAKMNADYKAGRLPPPAPGGAPTSPPSIKSN